jgi:hypothetical protein
LEEACAENGFSMIYYPKYHCELLEVNFIELVWGNIKQYHRNTSTYNFKDLETELPNTLENRISIQYVCPEGIHALLQIYFWLSSWIN